LYEPFGLAVLEAAQLGTPLVLADNATFRELWADAAVFVDPHDPDAWATTLAALLASPKDRKCLGARAQMRARPHAVATMVRATANIHTVAALSNC
jgi:glycosyltransferase involved in cell wall biosynthesis